MVLGGLFPNIALNPYLEAGILFFAWFLALRIGLYILTKIILKITTRTSTDLDDVLIKRSSKPLTLLSLLLAAFLSLKDLPVSSNLQSILHKTFFTLFALTISYLIFVLIDVSLVRVWKKLAQKTKSNIDDTIGQLVHEVLRIVILVVLAIAILNIWGFEIGPLLAGLGIAGLAVALALQPTLSNIFSGVSIIIDGTFKVGDVIKLESGEMGVVYKIGLRTTRIKSFDNEMLIIPNSQIANSRVQNFFQPDKSIRVNVEFGVEYGVDPEYIKKLAIEEIEKIKFTDKEKEIRILFLAMADNSLNFKAMFWVDDISKKWPAHQEAITRIYRRLYKEKIGIPFPQRTVWLRDEGKAKSPDPSDKQFSKVHGKYYPSFGHEYKEEKEEKKEETKAKKKTLFSRFKKLRKK